jgi:hypothetical protein
MHLWGGYPAHIALSLTYSTGPAHTHARSTSGLLDIEPAPTLAVAGGRWAGKEIVVVQYITFYDEIQTPKSFMLAHQKGRPLSHGPPAWSQQAVTARP